MLRSGSVPSAPPGVSSVSEVCQRTERTRLLEQQLLCVQPDSNDEGAVYPVVHHCRSCSMRLRFTLLFIVIVIAAVILAPSDTQRALKNKQKKKTRCECVKKVECPCGYLLFRGVCYLFVMGENKEIRNWWDAKNYCNNRGGNLVTVDQERREKFIRSYLETNFRYLDDEILIFTGLIYTDEKARYPISHHTDSAKATTEASRTRWISNGAVVGKWPLVNNTHNGPGPDVLSCVIFVFNMDSRTATWRYDSCYSGHRKIICEVRPPRTKSARRLKRSVSPSGNGLVSGDELSERTSNVGVQDEDNTKDSLDYDDGNDDDDNDNDYDSNTDENENL